MLPNDGGDVQRPARLVIPDDRRPRFTTARQRCCKSQHLRDNARGSLDCPWSAPLSSEILGHLTSISFERETEETIDPRLRQPPGQAHVASMHQQPKSMQVAWDVQECL